MGTAQFNYQMMHCRRSNTTVVCRAVVGTYQLYHACAGMSDVALGTFSRCLCFTLRRSHPYPGGIGAWRPLVVTMTVIAVTINGPQGPC